MSSDANDLFKHVEEHFKVPPKRPYQVPDLLTRIDEELELVIHQLNYMITLLMILAGVPVRGPAGPIRIEFPTGGALPRFMRIANVPFVIVNRKKYNITDGSPIEHTFASSTNEFFIYAESGDIYWDFSPIVEDSFVLESGQYMSSPRSKSIDRLYVMPKDSDTATFRILEISYTQE